MQSIPRVLLVRVGNGEQFEDFSKHPLIATFGPKNCNSLSDLPCSLKYFSGSLKEFYSLAVIEKYAFRMVWGERQRSKYSAKCILVFVV